MLEDNSSTPGSDSDVAARKDGAARSLPDALARDPSYQPESQASAPVRSRDASTDDFEAELREALLLDAASAPPREFDGTIFLPHGTFEPRDKLAICSGGTATIASGGCIDLSGSTILGTGTLVIGGAAADAGRDETKKTSRPRDLPEAA